MRTTLNEIEDLVDELREMKLRSDAIRSWLSVGHADGLHSFHRFASSLSDFLFEMEILSSGVYRSEDV